MYVWGHGPVGTPNCVYLSSWWFEITLKSSEVFSLYQQLCAMHQVSSPGSKTTPEHDVTTTMCNSWYSDPLDLYTLWLRNTIIVLSDHKTFSWRIFFCPCGQLQRWSLVKLGDVIFWSRGFFLGQQKWLQETFLSLNLWSSFSGCSELPGHVVLSVLVNPASAVRPTLLMLSKDKVPAVVKSGSLAGGLVLSC